MKFNLFNRGQKNCDWACVARVRHFNKTTEHAHCTLQLWFDLGSIWLVKNIKKTPQFHILSLCNKMTVAYSLIVWWIWQIWKKTQLMVYYLLVITITMRINLPKTISVLIFCLNLLNFSLKNISQTVKNLIFVYFY